jgi:hypothetical protein
MIPHFKSFTAHAGESAAEAIPVAANVMANA